MCTLTYYLVSRGPSCSNNYGILEFVNVANSNGGVLLTQTLLSRHNRRDPGDLPVAIEKSGPSRKGGKRRCDEPRKYDPQ